MIRTKGNEKLLMLREVKNRTRMWIMMALIVKVCKNIDYKRKIIMDRNERIAR